MIAYEKWNVFGSLIFSIIVFVFSQLYIIKFFLHKTEENI